MKRDGRGWPKGKRRRWSSQTEKQVAAIHRYLSQEPTEFYTGASAIELEWRRRWPQEPSPPLRTIGQMMSDLGLTKSPKKRDHRGAAAYLCYPEHTIYQSLRIPVKPATQSGESGHPVGAKRRWGFHDVSGGRFESM